MTGPLDSRRPPSSSFAYRVARKVIVCGAACLAALLPVQGRGQERRPGNPLNVPQGEAHAYLGVERCEQCHLGPSPTLANRGVTNFVLLNESKTWLADIHSQAFSLIDPEQSELSRQICERLGIEDIGESQACLSCHSSWLKDRPRPPTYQRGVACESCHGPSEHWDLPHTREDWRAKPVAEKAALGMIDVRNPIVRAEQCLSCHIGNAEEGKILTHEMYAAGHPPLPNIEVESFAKQMPPHWRYLREKPQFAKRDAFIRENNRYLLPETGSASDPVSEHRHGAAAVVLGGVIALRESLELTAAFAAQETQTWPALAAFDCAACHHDLRYPGWRGQQLALSPPGRPPLHQWPTALVRTAILHVSSNRQAYNTRLSRFDRGLQEIRHELEVVPFGHPSDVHTTCLELADWLTNELAAEVASRPFDEPAIWRSINLLALQGASDLQNFNSARQITWAIRALYCDLETRPAADTEIRAALSDLSDSLGLNLPNGGSDLCLTIPVGDAERTIVPLETGFTASALRAAAYDPSKFQEEMKRVMAALR